MPLIHVPAHLLRSDVPRQDPSPNTERLHQVAEQLSIYQQNLREKTRQMKAMASELNMYQAQVNEYKFEIERLTRELQVQPLNINHHPRPHPRISLIRLFP